jgi:hypothetical protein
VALVLLAAGFGDDDKDSEPPAPASTIPASSAAPTTVAPESTTTTGPIPATTTTSGIPATVFIDALNGPTTPVDCNAPTMEELSWTTSGATKVELFAGAQRLGQYPNGTARQIVPLKCDGSARTYTLRASKGNETVERSFTLSTKQI